MIHYRKKGSRYFSMKTKVDSPETCQSQIILIHRQILFFYAEIETQFKTWHKDKHKLNEDASPS